MILLYNPWSTHSEKKPLPMSLLAIGSLLEGEHEYQIVDGNLDPDPVARLAELGRAQRPTAIGVTVMPGPQLNIAVPDTRRLKELLPEVPIVWGGYFPSQHSQTVLQDPTIDFVVHGQGEQTFLELARTLRQGGDLGAIAGLSYRDDGGAIRRNPRRPLLPLDDLPDWPYDQVEMERYIHSHYLGRRVATHHSSYGCPFGCNFCAVVDMVQRRWLPQSAARVASILELHRNRWQVDAVQFHDMDFFISETRTADFVEWIAGLDLRWWALGRVDELMRYRDETWAKIKESGLKMVFCGAETGSDEVLAKMNKGGSMSTELTLELVRRMRSYGIVPELSFVVGNPPDPEADIATTLEFIRALKKVNPHTEIILYVYTPVPLDGTLWEEARALGFKYPDTLDEWVSGDWRDFSLRRDPQTPWLSRGLKRRVRHFERVLNAYYPTVTDTTLTGFKRLALKTLGSWRYGLRIYQLPLELELFQRLFRYQRPETTGF